MCESELGCIVEQLFLASFARKSFNEKKDVIARGRPTPAMTGLTKSNATSSFTRRFQTSIYQRSPWLTGCAKLNKLFCWPCVLFSSSKSTWNTKGFDDLGNLHGGIQKHERSQVHIRSVLALKTFESTWVDLQLDEQVELGIEQHNKNVKRNREVLQRLIDVATFLGSRGLQPGGDPCVHRGDYTELIQLLRRYDDRLDRHLETSTVFTGMSNHIQDDLVEAIGVVMLGEIKHEISQTPFISILLDRTNAAHVSTMLRYVSHNGVAVERFMGFSDVSEIHDAASLSRHVCDFVDELDCRWKLVAQTYDGAVVMSEELGDLQATVTVRCPYATFVHCRAHVLNAVLSQACSRNKHCKTFFSTLNGLASFFSASPKRTSALDEIVQRKFPWAAPTVWKDTSRLVDTAKEHCSSLAQLFSDIRNEPQTWDDNTVLMAGGFLHCFEDVKFGFLLEIFADIFSHTDALSSVLQSKSVDIGCCVGEVKRVTELLERKRLDFHAVFGRTVKTPGNPAKISKLSMDIEDECSQLYLDVFDTVLSQLRERFESLEKMKFLELLNLPKFTEYGRTFPEAAFTSLNETYGHFFDVALLHSELSVLYSSSALAKSDVAELTSYMNETRITEAMGEVYKLCCLFLTLPSTTASVESTFSTLRRIKTFAQNTVAQVHLSGLSLMAIERKLLHKVKAEDTFYDKVIECFVKKNQCMDFVYRGAVN